MYLHRPRLESVVGVESSSVPGPGTVGSAIPVSNPRAAIVRSLALSGADMHVGLGAGIVWIEYMRDCCRDGLRLSGSMPAMSALIADIHAGIR
jgi:hypothetical protein